MADPNIQPTQDDDPHFFTRLPTIQDPGTLKELRVNATLRFRNEPQPDYISQVSDSSWNRPSSVVSSLEPNNPQNLPRRQALDSTGRLTKPHSIPPYVHRPASGNAEFILLVYGKLLNWPSDLIAYALNDIWLIAPPRVTGADVDRIYNQYTRTNPEWLTAECLLQQPEYKGIVHELRIRNYDARDLQVGPQQLSQQQHLAAEQSHEESELVNDYDEGMEQIKIDWAIDVTIAYGFLSDWPWETIASALAFILKVDKQFDAAEVERYYKIDMILERQTEQWLATQPGVDYYVSLLRQAGLSGIDLQAGPTIINTSADDLWKQLARPPVANDPAMHKIEQLVITFGMLSRWGYDMICQALRAVYKAPYDIRFSLTDLDNFHTKLLNTPGDPVDNLLRQPELRGLVFLLKLEGFPCRNLYDNVDFAKQAKRKEHINDRVQRTLLTFETIKRRWTAIEWRRKIELHLFDRPKPGTPFLEVEEIIIGYGRHCFGWDWSLIAIALQDIYVWTSTASRSIYEIREYYEDYLQYVPFEYWTQVTSFEEVWMTLADLGYKIDGTVRLVIDKEQDKQISKWSKAQASVVYSPLPSISTVPTPAPRTTSEKSPPIVERLTDDEGQIIPEGARIEHIREPSPNSLAMFPKEMKERFTKEKERFPKRISCQNSPEPEEQKMEATQQKGEEVGLDPQEPLEMEKSEQERRKAILPEPSTQSLPINPESGPSKYSYDGAADDDDDDDGGDGSELLTDRLNPDVSKNEKALTVNDIVFTAPLGVDPIPAWPSFASMRQPLHEDHLWDRSYLPRCIPTDLSHLKKILSQPQVDKIFRKVVEDVQYDDAFWEKAFADIHLQPKCIDIEEILPVDDVIKSAIDGQNPQTARAWVRQIRKYTEHGVVTLPTSPADLRPLPNFLKQLSHDKFVDVHEITNWFEKHKKLKTKQMMMMKIYPFPLIPHIKYQNPVPEDFLPVEEMGITIGIRDHCWGVKRVTAAVRYLWDPNYFWEVHPRTEEEIRNWWNKRDPLLREKMWGKHAKGYKEVYAVLQGGGFMDNLFGSFQFATKDNEEKDGKENSKEKEEVKRAKRLKIGRDNFEEWEALRRYANPWAVEADARAAEERVRRNQQMFEEQQNAKREEWRRSYAVKYGPHDHGAGQINNNGEGSSGKGKERADGKRTEKGDTEGSGEAAGQGSSRNA